MRKLSFIQYFVAQKKISTLLISELIKFSHFDNVNAKTVHKNATKTVQNYVNLLFLRVEFERWSLVRHPSTPSSRLQQCASNFICLLLYFDSRFPKISRQFYDNFP